MRFCFLEIAVEDRTTSKISGQFQKAKLRRARKYTVLHSRNGSIPRLLRVTNGHSSSNVSVSSLSSGLQANRRSFAEKKRLLLLRLQNGSAVLHSGIDILRFSICIGRDEPFGAKPPQAGSHKSLMYLFEAKELFIGNRQNAERPYRKASHTLKKCRHFLPSVRVYTTHGSSTRQGFCCVFL